MIRRKGGKWVGLRGPWWRRASFKAEHNGNGDMGVRNTALRDYYQQDMGEKAGMVDWVKSWMSCLHFRGKEEHNIYKWSTSGIWENFPWLGNIFSSFAKMNFPFSPNRITMYHKYPGCRYHLGASLSSYFKGWWKSMGLLQKYRGPGQPLKSLQIKNKWNKTKPL